MLAHCTLVRYVSENFSKIRFIALLLSASSDMHNLWAIGCDLITVMSSKIKNWCPAGDELDIAALAHNAAGQAEVVVRKLIQVGWSCCQFHHLPAWLQDNDFLTHGHRPPLPSFRACFKSIFRIHTETANIWTHLLGCVAFIGNVFWNCYSHYIFHKSIKRKGIYAICSQANDLWHPAPICINIIQLNIITW